MDRKHPLNIENTKSLTTPLKIFHPLTFFIKKYIKNKI